MSLLLKSVDLSSKPSRLVQTLWQVNEPAEEEPRLLQRRAPVRSTAENEVLDRVSVNGTIYIDLARCCVNYGKILILFHQPFTFRCQ